ncbi:MAG: hypothetical protein WC662_02320 [Candidatus Paceibacterota bacterium]
MKNISKKLILTIFVLSLFIFSNNLAQASTANATTLSATSITETYMTMRGDYSTSGESGNEEIHTWFEYGTNYNLVSDGNGYNRGYTLRTSDSGSFSYSLTGLNSDTTYYFRAVVSRNGIIDYGNILEATTEDNYYNNYCTEPEIDRLSPDEVTAGDGSVTVTIYGSDFNSNSYALFGGASRNTDYISSSRLKMYLYSSDIYYAGTTKITVKNYLNGTTCTSNQETFTINSVNNDNDNDNQYDYPLVATSNASGISFYSAMLNGSVNPNSQTTTTWFEYGPSRNLATFYETTHLPEGSGNYSVPVNQTITGLGENTTYYFRIVANNTSGTKRGNIISFTTAARPVASGITNTVQATNQTYNSAKLNGVFINRNNSLAQGYFQYGTSTALGWNTTVSNLGTNSSTSFSNTITGLLPNTIYYFRAVGINSGSTYFGNMLVFKTPNIYGTIVGDVEPLSDIPPVDNTPTNPKPVINKPAPVINPEPVVKEIVQNPTLEITTSKENISSGDEVEYLVKFKNNNDKNFEDVKISVQLPNEIDFKESNFGKEENSNTVIFDVGTLIPSQVGSITIKSKVNGKNLGQDTIITTVLMSYYKNNSDLKNDEIAYVANNIIGNENLAAASVLGNNSFLPSTLIGWAILIILILALALVVRKIYGNYSMKKIFIGNGDHINNLPM